MEHPERNTALTAQAAMLTARAPGPLSPLAFLERTWFQWVAGLVASASPLIAIGFVIERGSAWQSSTVARAFVGLFFLLNGFLLYTVVRTFDGLANWSIRWLLSMYMKLLAIMHAVGAMYLVAELRYGIALPNGDDVPDLLIWLAIGFCWTVAGVAYLTGDAHIRIWRRG